jgi:hypothetical protein
LRLQERRFCIWGEVSEYCDTDWRGEEDMGILLVLRVDYYEDAVFYRGFRGSHAENFFEAFGHFEERLGDWRGEISVCFFFFFFFKLLDELEEIYVDIE